MGRDGFGRFGALIALLACAGWLTTNAVAQSNALVDEAGNNRDNQTATAAYVVTFEEAGLLYYSGNQAGLAATRNARDQRGKFDSRAPAAQAYSEFLKGQKDLRMASFENVLSRDLRMRYHYQATPPRGTARPDRC